MSNQVYKNQIEKYPADLPANAVTTTSLQTLSNKTLDSTSRYDLISTPGFMCTYAPTVDILGHNPKVYFYSWTLTTVGTSPASSTTAVSIGTPITLRSLCQAVQTAGPNVNSTLSRQTSSLVNTSSGSAVWVADYQQIGGNEVPALAASTLTHLAAGTNVSTLVTGVAGVTLIWYGTTYIYY